MSAEVTSAASIGVLASGVATVWPSGKNDSLPQLRDAQLHIARLGGQQPLTSQQCSSPNSSGNDSTKTSSASAPC